MESDLKVLRSINSNDSVKQRELADSTGLSVGMVNAIIKRLVTKGFVMAKRINSRNVKYLVTPSGLEALSGKTRSYIKTTLSSVDHYRYKIENLVTSLKDENCQTLNLIGDSKVDFILEFYCHKNGIKFLRNEEKIDGVNIVGEFDESDCEDIRLFEILKD